MTTKLYRGREDDQLNQVRDALQSYQDSRRNAEIPFYEQNPHSIRICIIDASFRTRPVQDREEEIWWELSDVDDATYGNVTLLVMLGPEEAKDSLLYLGFMHPLPPQL